jgi:hypothetical protein
MEMYIWSIIIGICGGFLIHILIYYFIFQYIMIECEDASIFYVGMTFKIGNKFYKKLKE